MINHAVWELLHELAVVFLVEASPCFGIALDGLQSVGPAQLERVGQFFVDAEVVSSGLNDFEPGFARVDQLHQTMTESSSAMTSSWL